MHWGAYRRGFQKTTLPSRQKLSQWRDFWKDIWRKVGFLLCAGWNTATTVVTTKRRIKPVKSVTDSTMFHRPTAGSSRRHSFDSHSDRLWRCGTQKWRWSAPRQCQETLWRNTALSTSSSAAALVKELNYIWVAATSMSAKLDFSLENKLQTTSSLCTH